MRILVWHTIWQKIEEDLKTTSETPNAFIVYGHYVED